MPQPPKPKIGWRELVALPEWHITGLRAKIDTGARTSAIDVDQIELLPANRVRFDIVLSNKHRRRRKWITADIVRTTTVRSSNGEREDRYVVSTILQLGEHRHVAEFTLVSRADMLCRMLIGRTAIAPHFLVDASRTYLTKARRKIKKDSL